MSREAGSTVIELLVASGIMLAASAAALMLADHATARSPHWNDVADLHQRARVAVEAISRHVALAGGATGTLTPAFPAIEPRRRSSFLPSAAAITVRHVPESAAWSVTTGDLAPGDASIAIRIHPGCPDGVERCGFGKLADAMILGPGNEWHLLSVMPAGLALLACADAVPGRTATFPAGSTLVEVEESALFFDPGTRSLRQEGPGAGNFPVVDQIGALALEYFGQGGVPLPLASLADGPLCGSGSLAYDCDLRRIRIVRAMLTVQGGTNVRDLRVSVDIAVRRRFQ